MSELRFETIQFPTAELYDVNPYIPMRTADVHQEVKTDDSIPEEDREFVGKGFRKNCLPHLMQDRYSRDIKERDFKIAVLENEYTKATFSLDYGGRLLSLFSKTHNKELLSVNPVFQPANLALRNAWYSGGVEWNIGLIGHNAHTCSPLFTGQLTTDDGTPVLRMYEYERIRKVPYQLDFYLKDDNPFLFVKVRIINPFDHDVYMYWWSNIAVDEREDVRVLVPADHCYRFGYEGVMKRLETPIDAKTNVDYSYTTNTTRAMDYFFRLPNEQRRWISSLDKDGQGLVQTSTDRLKGRKLFVWGRSEGGANWQKFLSHGQSEYLEIQAGLGRTQTEHIAMPPGEWSWLEAYGILDADAASVHQDNWAQATAHVDDSLEQTLSRAFLDQEHERAQAIADKEMDKIIQHGSGWGTLERKRREKDGEKPMCGSHMKFTDESIDDDQQAWLDVLEANTYTHSADIAAAPIIEEPWISKLEAAEKNHEGWYQLGVMYYAEERLDDAQKAWEESVNIQSNPFALRCLGILARIQKDYGKAVKYYKEARQQTDDMTIVCEYAKAALELKDFRLAQEVIEASPISNGRTMLYLGHAWLGQNEYDKVEDIFKREEAYIITDLREGEKGFDELWFKMHEQKIMQERGLDTVTDEIFYEAQEKNPVPKTYNFLMSPRMSPSERKAAGLD